MPAIEVHDLSVRYGDFHAVRGISFDVAAGEIVTLLGPNGAGKTTTIETVEGYRSPTSGSVRVLGLDPVADHSTLVTSIGVMLQGLGVYPQLAPLRALRLFASYFEAPRDPRELIDQLDLAHVQHTPAKRLSGGERQRLALALALIGRPRVVFLDEPTAGIDPGGRVAVRTLISGLREDGVAIILTTHELDEAERLADRIVIMSEGSIASSGRLKDLRRATDSIRFETNEPITIEELSRDIKIQVVRESNDSYRVDTEDISATVSSLTAWINEHHYEITSLRSGGQTLEEIYLAATAFSKGESKPERASRPRRSKRGQM